MMDQRPDSPAPANHAETPADTAAPHRQARSRHGRKDEDNGQSRLASMIDVVFLLLIFFVVTANFQIDEGAIVATLPGDAAPKDPPPPIPPPSVLIDMASADDGVTYTLTVDGQPLEGVAQLYDYLDRRVRSGAMMKDQPVQIRPQNVVRWQHVVNVFNACIRADLEQVGFAAVASAGPR